MLLLPDWHYSCHSFKNDSMILTILKESDVHVSTKVVTQSKSSVWLHLLSTDNIIFTLACKPSKPHKPHKPPEPPEPPEPREPHKPHKPFGKLGKFGKSGKSGKFGKFGKFGELGRLGKNGKHLDPPEGKR